jgi:7-cyano-7-deazaguanine synthase
VEACVLVSGGVESSALLVDALRRYASVTPLYVRNRLFWETSEFFWLRRFLKKIKSPKLKPLKNLELPMSVVYVRHWSTTGTNVPSASSDDKMVYLPGRNILFLSKAASFAALEGISTLEIGVLKGNPFSDSSEFFFKKISEVLSLGLGRPMVVKAPFRKLKKEDIISRFKELPFDLTFSCISPKKNRHCGVCNKCAERKRAFFSAGVKDKTHYED